MRPKYWRLTAVVAAAAWMAACATIKPAPSPTTASAPAIPANLQEEPSQPVTSAFAGLPGWEHDDHAAALAAFRAGCVAVRNPALARVCEQAIALGPVDEAQSRTFLEQSFRLEPIADTGLLTGYFAPEYEARLRPEGEFSAPVRRRPVDLRSGDLSGYPTRAEIEQWPTTDALAWMRPEDLFFLQVQGSGSLAFPNGARMMAVSDGTNGARFVAISQPMRTAGLLADDNTSADAIRTWLSAHRGSQAQALMNLNPRYVFFRLRVDDGKDPAGSAGAPLIPGRSIAVDRDRYALGEMVWIDADAPVLTDAFPVYQRLAVALDTGGAIKGAGRVDLYLGRGPAAGLEAGRIRHELRLYRLTPVER